MVGPHIRRSLRNRRFDSTSRSALGLLVTFGFATITGHAAAQSTTPPVVQGEIVAPIEIFIETINGEVQCGPPRVRLPSLDAVEIEVINRAEILVMFLAPEFFESAEIVETTDFALQILEGGFQVEPESAVRVIMQTPSAGEYGYACYEPGGLPTPESSGFLVVIPTPAEN